MDRALDRARDDLAFAMVRGGVVNDAMAQQRPILHQAEHGIPLCLRRTIHSENGCPLSGIVRGSIFLGPAPSPVSAKVAVAASHATVSFWPTARRPPPGLPKYRNPVQY